MKKHFLVMSLLAACAVPASAGNLYVYGDAGKSKFSGSDSDSTFDLGLGYNINKSFSFEVGYHDLGGVTVSDSIYYPGVGDIAVNGSAEASTIQASFVGVLPLNESFDVHARLGYARIKTDVSAKASYQGISESSSESDTANKALYGVGVGYKVKENFAVRAEYTEYNDADVSTITVGFTYGF